MIKIGIVGISGYSGGLVLELLLKHPEVRVTYVSANNTIGKIDDIWPQLKGKTNLYCDKFNHEQAAKSCDFLFLAVPHTIAASIAPKLLVAGKRIIDLSADYRLKDVQLYKKWYGVAHPDKSNLKKAVYGLPELYREDMKKASLIANPGCYPTAAILALAPLIVTKTKSIASIFIDAKSGVTGAGRKATLALSFSELNENLKPYKVLQHQHVPEIESYLSQLGKTPFEVSFVPHLIPMSRGILETIYVQMKSAPDLDKIHDMYKKFYKNEQFVRVLNPGLQPEVKNVNYTNYCDIALSTDVKRKLVVITVAIDNLMKGASGQAVQNMNIMCHFKENSALA